MQTGLCHHFTTMAFNNEWANHRLLSASLRLSPMLAGTDVKPPQLDDFFCANDAPLRADDLALLGRSEQEIWGQ